MKKDSYNSPEGFRYRFELNHLAIKKFLSNHGLVPFLLYNTQLIEIE